MRDLDLPDKDALVRGMSNLKHLINVIKGFGLPVVVAVNSFPTDVREETELVRTLSTDSGADHAELSTVFEQGGDGAIDLANAVVKATAGKRPNINYMYDVKDTLEDKISAIARNMYNARGVVYSAKARRSLREFQKNGWGLGKNSR